MSKNVGGLDRLVRLIVGLGLLSLLVLLEGSQRWLGLIGLVPLATAGLSFCPLYPLVGLNTCRRCGSDGER
ncbi:MAG: DUF2892 domain-containing protein [Rhodospirillaceae bacterium]